MKVDMNTNEPPKKPDHKFFLNRSHFIISIICFLVIILVYFLLHGKYHIENVDDPWSLTFSYNLINKGEVYDTVFLNGEGEGTSLFSMIYAYTYGSILNIIGWTKSNSHLISTFFFLSSLPLWFFIILKLGHEKYLALSFILILLLSECYFGLANQARADALTFLLVTLSFFLFLYKFYFFSGLVTMLAFENHATGSMIFFYIVIFIISHRNEFLEDRKLLFRKIILFGLGILIGASIYLYLHYPYLVNFTKTIGERTEMTNSKHNNFILSYFFETKYYRHIPELVIIAAAIIIFISKKYFKENKFILLFIGFVILASIVLRRPNFNYIVYAYPSFVLLILYVADRIKKINWVLIIFLIILIPQYFYVFNLNRQYDEKAYVEKLKQSLIPEDTDVIFGSPNEWFAFIDKDFYRYTLIPVKKEVEEFVLIEENDFRTSGIKPYVESNYQITQLDSFNVNNEMFIINLCKKKD